MGVEGPIGAAEIRHRVGRSCSEIALKSGTRAPSGVVGSFGAVGTAGAGTPGVVIGTEGAAGTLAGADGTAAPGDWPSRRK